MHLPGRAAASPSGDNAPVDCEILAGAAVVAGTYILSRRAAVFDRFVAWVQRNQRRRADDFVVTGVVATAVAVILAQRRTGRVLRRLRHASHTDPLTGLPNRAWLTERLQHALTRRRTDTELAVYFIDLDGYKQVNDRWGHAAGDEVLVDIADRLQACVRAHDTVARVGGDEFVVLVEDVDPAETQLIGKRLEAAVPGTRSLDRDLSASIGVAIARDQTETPADLLERADAAMYEAKSCRTRPRIPR